MLKHNKIPDLERIISVAREEAAKNQRGIIRVLDFAQVVGMEVHHLRTCLARLYREQWLIPYEGGFGGFVLGENASAYTYYKEWYKRKWLQIFYVNNTFLCQILVLLLTAIIGFISGNIISRGDKTEQVQRDSLQEAAIGAINAQLPNFLPKTIYYQDTGKVVIDSSSKNPPVSPNQNTLKSP